MPRRKPHTKKRRRRKKRRPSKRRRSRLRRRRKFLKKKGGAVENALAPVEVSFGPQGTPIQFILKYIISVDGELVDQLLPCARGEGGRRIDVGRIFVDPRTTRSNIENDLRTKAFEHFKTLKDTLIAKYTRDLEALKLQTFAGGDFRAPLQLKLDRDRARNYLATAKAITASATAALHAPLNLAPHHYNWTANKNINDYWDTLVGIGADKIDPSETLPSWNIILTADLEVAQATPPAPPSGTDAPSLEELRARFAALSRPAARQ